MAVCRKECGMNRDFAIPADHVHLVNLRASCSSSQSHLNQSIAKATNSRGLLRRISQNAEWWKQALHTQAE
jgi:hypothetical protein